MVTGPVVQSETAAFFRAFFGSYEGNSSKPRPWHEELNLTQLEMKLLKRLLGIECRYRNIGEVESGYRLLMA